MDVSIHPCIPGGRAGSCGGGKQVTGREEGRRSVCVCVCVCVCTRACAPVTMHADYSGSKTVK